MSNTKVSNSKTFIYEGWFLYSSTDLFVDEQNKSYLLAL